MEMLASVAWKRRLIRDLWNNGNVSGVMGPRLATIVVESRSLVREALISLMAKHSYRVVCGVASTAEIVAQPSPRNPSL
jgi:hypothetical protein